MRIYHKVCFFCSIFVLLITLNSCAPEIQGSLPTAAPVATIQMETIPLPSQPGLITPAPMEDQDPSKLLEMLLRMQDEKGYFFTFAEVKPILVTYGADANWLDSRASYFGFPLSEEDKVLLALNKNDALFIQEMDSERTGIEAVGLLRISIDSGNSFAMVFLQRNGIWKCTGTFECAEAGHDTDDVENPEVQIWEMEAANGKSQIFLAARGRRDHGTGRFSSETDLYDVTNSAPALRYMSKLHAMRGDKEAWLAYSINTSYELVYEKGTILFKLYYTGQLIDSEMYYTGGYDGKLEDCAYYQESFIVPYVQDTITNKLIPMDDSAAARIWPVSLDNPQFFMYTSIPAADFPVIFPDMQDKLAKLDNNWKITWLKRVQEQSP